MVTTGKDVPSRLPRKAPLSPLSVKGETRGMTIKQAVAHNARYKKQNAIRDR